MTPLRALVVDDEKNIRTTLGMCLESLDCQVVLTATPEAALAALQQRPCDLAFLDLRLADQSGLDLLPRLLAEHPDLAVVVITAYATVDTAVEAMKRGARDYLAKPFTPAQVRHVVEQARERRALVSRLGDLEAQLADALPEVDLDSQAAPMHRALDLVLRAAASDVGVLLRGESGTGKGVLARLLHQRSARAGGPFVTVSCPTLSEELLASELFGHARGAFTGAIKDRPGRVEAASGGTLFLDEIGEIPPALQAKLLRFLQDHEFERLGESRTRTADVRVVAATHRDLEADVKAGRFREDLFYRLAVVEVTLPPLRERPDDVLRLARRFVAFFARSARRRTPALSGEAERVLQAYPWPGNVRELRNAIERAVMLWPSDVVEPSAFPERVGGHAAPAPAGRVGGDVTLEDLEREHVLAVLARCPVQEEAARVLGIDPSTLWRKRKRYGV
jgi:NtrC-family two-component system response regulator AlgB